jgi:PLP dependent protein
MSSSSPDIKQSLSQVLARIDVQCEKSNRRRDSVRLVAASKTKPLELVLRSYEAGQRHFGENYVQELVEKSVAFDEQASGDNHIKWHFIGRLQSNKCKLLSRAVNLRCVETLHSVSTARQLDKAVANRDVARCSDPLDVFIQVNASGEASKSGVSSRHECSQLAADIAGECAHLRVAGVMTIGTPGRGNDDAQPDFDELVLCRRAVADTLRVDERDLALSMGMSADFEAAIDHGATHVRVGSLIFGQRNYSK